MSTTPLVPSLATLRERRVPQVILAFTMFTTGAAGIIYQDVLSTVFSYLLGNSIEQFSIVIGVMMFLMGLSGIWQKKLRKALVETFVVTELLLVLLGGFGPLVLQWFYASAGDDFVWLKLVYPGIIGFIIGAEIPLIMRINEHFTRNLGNNIASTWAFDYLGGAVGACVWIWMLRHIPIDQISIVTGGTNLLIAVISILFFWREGLFSFRWSAPLLSVVAIVMSGLLVVGYHQADTWSKTITQKLYDDPIAWSATTKYQNIVMTKGPHPTNPRDNNWQLWLNGNKQFSSVDEAMYHEPLVHPAMNLAAKHEHVLILGGGDGMALREVLKYKDVRDVTLVDLDPAMIELARTNPVMRKLNNGSFADARVTSNLNDAALSAGMTDTGSKQDVLLATDEVKKVDCPEQNASGARTSECRTEPVLEKVATVNVFTVDADRFVTDRPGYWDVVIIDLPDPNSVELAKLYSKEFYAKVRPVMSPDGMVVVQATSPYHAKETFLCILRTMAAAGLNVVPYHDNVPSFGDWGWILGSPSLPTATLFDRANTLDGFGVPTKEIDSIKRMLIFNRGWLTSHSKEVSTLMHPAVFDFYIYDGWKVE